jgi:lipopolysaccharide biosynthesis protein
VEVAVENPWLDFYKAGWRVGRMPNDSTSFEEFLPVVISKFGLNFDSFINDVPTNKSPILLINKSDITKYPFHDQIFYQKKFQIYPYGCHNIPIAYNQFLNSSGQDLISKNIAIVYHAYYIDVFEIDIQKLIGFPSDTKIFCSTSVENYNSVLLLINKYWKYSFEIFIFENKGRDVLPFLNIFKRVSDENYEFVLKLHTKKSVHMPDGDRWRVVLIDSLSNYSNISICIDKFREDRHMGMFSIGDYLYPLNINIKPNLSHIFELLVRLGVDPFSIDQNEFVFPAGTMFLARVEALRPLFCYDLSNLHFEDELGQIDGTLAHAFERMFAIIVTESGYKIEKI